MILHPIMAKNVRGIQTETIHKVANVVGRFSFPLFCTINSLPYKPYLLLYLNSYFTLSYILPYLTLHLTLPYILPYLILHLTLPYALSYLT